MKRLGAWLAALFWLAPLSGAPARASDAAAPPARDDSPIPAETRQLIVVRSASWEASVGSLQRFTRGAAASAWGALDQEIPVNLGKQGMAWGRGLQQSDMQGPVKREGDHRSPAGVFAIGPAFGYRDSPPDGSKGYPYIHVRGAVSCIEDSRSRYYNRLIDPGTVARADWSSLDRMRRADGLFRWGVVVEHNAAGTVRGAGSCVFLHIWRGPGQGTAGCTAMAAEIVEEVIRWLDAAQRPVLVQLPRGEYERLQSSWALP